MTGKTIRGLLAFVVSTLIILLAGFILLYAADSMGSFGLVLVVLVPFSIGFAVGYSGPVPPMLSGILAVLSCGLVLLFGVVLGYAGILCASILLALAGVPLVVGAAMAVYARRALEKKRRRSRVSTTLSILFFANLLLLYGEIQLPWSFQPETVETVRVVDLPASEVWNRFLFYEDWDHDPPLLLKLAVPRPRFTVGPVTGPGDIKTCVYDSGHLVKRITRHLAAQELSFDVIEQIGIEDRSVQLLGGSLRLDTLGPGRTRVELVTRYIPKLQARLFWRPWEQRVTRFLHEHILDGVESREAGRASPLWGLEP